MKLLRIVKQPIMYKKEQTVLGYYNNVRLLDFVYRNNCWYAELLTDRVELKPLKFIKRLDRVIGLVKIEIYVPDTPFGDLSIYDFKALKTNSILETIPEELIMFIEEH